MRTAVAASLLAFVAAGSAGAADRVKTISASEGQVTAQVTYRERDRVHSNVRVRIARAGENVVTAPLGRLCPHCRDEGLLLVAGLKVRDLDRDAEPEVLLDLYSGGTHCCFSTLFFGYVGGRYARALEDWGNYAYDLKDLDTDGQPELVSADNRFAYAFVPYAFSVPPVQIWRFRVGELIDVTRDFPAIVEKSARGHLRFYQRGPRRTIFAWDARGILAAYLAEMYLLGREQEGWRVLGRAYARGDLRRDGTDDPYPGGRIYLKNLRTFLRAAGYARGA